MAHIVHIALQVDNVDRLSQLYRELFGFIHTGTIVNPATKSNGHIIRSGYVAHHLNDGLIDFALVHYEDEGYADVGSCGSQLTGIHHFGIEDSDPEEAANRIRANGGEIISEPGTLPVKFRAPGGIIGEVIPENRFTAERIIQAAKAAKKREQEAGTPPSRYEVASLEIHDGPVHRNEHAPSLTHLSLKVNDYERVTQFFQEVFGFTSANGTHEHDQKSSYLTDGNFIIEISNFQGAQSKFAQCAGDKPCIHHITVEVDASDIQRLVSKLREANCEFVGESTSPTVTFKAPGEGTVLNLAPFGWQSRRSTN